MTTKNDYVETWWNGGDTPPLVQGLKPVFRVLKSEGHCIKCMGLRNLMIPVSALLFLALQYL
jgi:hypothetical protein